MPRIEWTRMRVPSGTSSVAASRTAVLKDFSRRLPEMPRSVAMCAAYYDRMSDELRFERDADGHRYRALIGSDEVAFAEVDAIGKTSLLIKHTEVLPAFEGRGIGGKLVRHMLVEARSQGRSVIPICPYAT